MKPKINLAGDALQQQMKRNIEVTKSLFAQAQGSDIREISEADFCQHFLPYFCGELPVTPEVKPAWVMVAGTAFNPVNIVKDGKVVAQVPALIDSSVVKAVGQRYRNNTSDVDTALHASKMRSSASPALAQNMLATELVNRFQVSDDGPSQKLREQWETLLKYYGKLPPDGNINDPVKKTESTTESEFDYTEDDQP